MAGLIEEVDLLLAYVLAELGTMELDYKLHSSIANIESRCHSYIICAALWRCEIV